MQESASTAMSFVRSRADASCSTRVAQDHRSPPARAAGGMPKDGPSAGVTMFTAVASLLLDCPVQTTSRMTGEISLRGNVLPVGGIKEKLLAAHRAGSKVLVPRRNERTSTTCRQKFGLISISSSSAGWTRC